MAQDHEPKAAEPLPAADGTATAPEPKKESLWSFLRFLLLLFFASVLLRSLVIAPFSIPSGSMLPTLMVGDYLFVSKWSYGYSRYSFPFGILGFQGRVLGSVPERGDVVVFRYPGELNEDFVKRVIAVPGDTVEIRGGAVILNGQPIGRERVADYVMPVTENLLAGKADNPCHIMPGSGARDFVNAEGQRVCTFPRYRETLPGGRSFDVLDQLAMSGSRSVGDNTRIGADNVAPFTVPEGHVFVMGDNRDDSLDGRFPTAQGGVGMLPVDYVQGRALVSFFSTDGSAEWLLPWTWFTAARWSRIGQTYP